MTDTSAAGGRGASAARPGLINRHDLVAALDHAAGKRVTIISAPAGSARLSPPRSPDSDDDNPTTRVGSGARRAVGGPAPGHRGTP
jgi:hypothetical protein